MAKKKTTKKKVDGRGKSPNSKKNLNLWKPGESGNPKGKPKGRTMKSVLLDFMDSSPTTREIKSLAEDYNGNVSSTKETEIKTLIQDLETQLGRKLTRADLMGIQVIKKALKHGDVSAFNAILDRIEGKPVQVNKNENTNTTYVDFLNSRTNEDDNNE